jgi:predicted CoA-binding protein
MNIMGKVVAVVGASADRHKFGNKAVRAFLAAGDDVVPINPVGEQIEGLHTYRSVLDVPREIDMATVYVPPDIALQLLPQFVEKRIGEVWLNPGADDDAVVAEARRLGLNVIVACSIVGAGQNPRNF